MDLDWCWVEELPRRDEEPTGDDAGGEVVGGGRRRLGVR